MNKTNNLYFIECDNYKLLELEVLKILKENGFSKDELIKYDLSEMTTLSLINELDTYSIFQEKKAVLGYDAVFLTTEKSEIEQNTKVLEDYLNNPNTVNILILNCSKLDNKKKISSLIKSKCLCLNIDVNIENIIKSKLQGYKISDSNLRYLISLLGDNIERVDNEIDKLMLYKIDEKIIEREDIDKIIIKISENNIFALMDAIIKKNKALSFKIYNDLMNNKTEPLKIIISLAYQMRLIYQVKVLSYMKDDEIANILNIKNPKQVRAIRYKTNNFTESELINNLHKLALLDEEIKTNKTFIEVSIPMFIASL